MKVSLAVVCIFIFYCSFLGQNDTISIVSYNLLNFPEGRNDCSASNVNPLNRVDSLRKILGYLKPDIFVACEIQSKAGADSVLSRSLNVFGATNYAMAPFQYSLGGGGELNNALFYNSNKVTFLRQKVIQTSSRDINHYTLYAVDPNLFLHHDTIFIEVYMAHLKAGSGVPEQVTRAEQTEIFRAYVDARPLMRNHFICGDLNVYKSSEACYQNLVSGGSLPFADPINSPGNWNNNSSFSGIHTQSTRSSGSFACGSTGGLDDRFDQILTTQNVLNGSDRLLYLTNSYKAVGNDGLHFNNSIWGGIPNQLYPDSVLRALYYMSDHLPVTLKVVPQLPTTNGLGLIYSNNGPLCAGSANGTATVTSTFGIAPFTYLWDTNAGSHNTPTAMNLTAGSYCVTVTDSLGFSDMVCFEIEERPALSVGVFTTNATVFCDGEAVAIVNGGTPPYSFLWDDPNAQLTQTATNLCPGIYSCVVSDSIYCSENVMISIYGTIGLFEELLENKQIGVVPNPIDLELNLLNSSNHKVLIDWLELLDINGKLVAEFGKTELVAGSKTTINMAFLPKGVYFLKISSEKMGFYIKVIK